MPGPSLQFWPQSCPGQNWGWGGGHLCSLSPRLGPCSDRRLALPLYHCDAPSPVPSPIPAARLRRPFSCISLASGPTPPGSLPCCPRCQILSPRGIRIETGACVSFSAPMEHCGWSQLCPYPSPSRGQEDPEGWRFIKINSSSSLPLVARVQFGGPPHWPPFLQPPSPRSLQGGCRRPRINPHTAPAAASSPQVHTASDPVTMHVT